MTWGSNLRREREARGWTRTEVADRIGSVEGTVRSLEEADTQPVRSKHAKSLMALYELGDDAVAAVNPRLLEASPQQLARRLADLLNAEEGTRPKHDQSNVSPGHESWRNVPIERPNDGGAQA